MYVNIQMGLYNVCGNVRQRSKIKGMICYVVGYAEKIDWHLPNILCQFVDRGYVCFCFDHFGHGRSDGLWTFVPEFGLMVENAVLMCNYAKRKYVDKEFKGVLNRTRNVFLLGTSMGGAISIHVSLIQPDDWRGLLLVAPMCSIDDNVLLYILFHSLSLSRSLSLSSFCVCVCVCRFFL